MSIDVSNMNYNNVIEIAKLLKKEIAIKRFKNNIKIVI